jgi:serine/threonine protein kinase
MSIVKNPGTPRYSISIDEFRSICSISDKDMKNSIGEIKECLKFNSNVTLIRSIKNHIQMKSIHKRFAHNKQTLMNNEITLLNKAAGMGVAYSLVYPRLLCKSDPDAGLDIIIEYCGIDIGLYYQNKNFKKGGESGVVFRDMVFTLSQLLNGLKEMGFYHGDVRIENIMRDKSKVKFIDFECGILDPKINNELEEVEISMYGLSPQYSPPELLDQFDKIRNHEPLRVYPRKIDIYCLARCFVLILTRNVNKNVVSNLSYFFNLAQSEVGHIFAEKNFTRLGLLIGNNYDYMLKLIADISNPFSPSQNDRFTKFKTVLYTIRIRKYLSRKYSRKMLLTQIQNARW